ncbi:MAG TPA: hypothetical protein VMH89_15925 [Candidatus Acidoferrum sp.]|nr:hypothetical protein [Candidatus Acidoferrum sp.]
MRIGKQTLRGLTFTLYLFGLFAHPCSAQRSAKSWDELIQYQADFLRVFYPESVGKKYWITFEAATFYDEIGNTPAEKRWMSFNVDIGDGPKSSQIMCCISASMGGIIGTDKPQQKPVPLPSKSKPMNLGPRGQVYPKQYLRTVFLFDPNGQLSGFRRLANNPPKDEPDFWTELQRRPDMSDAELTAAYNKSGAKYALGDREALKRDLPVATLETFVGKLKIITIKFTPTGNKRIDALGGFSDCHVYLEGPEQKRFAAQIDGSSGQLVSFFYISEKERKFFWDDFFNPSEESPD